MLSKVCCGFSLRGGVRIIAVTDVVVELATMAFMILSIVPRAQRLWRSQSPEYNYVHDHTDDNLRAVGGFSIHAAVVRALPNDEAMIGLESTSLLIHVVEFCIVYLVFQGGQQRSMPKSRIWARLTEVLTGIDGIIFVTSMILEFNVGMVVFMVLDLGYKSYSCAVVEAFMREIQTYEVPQNERTELN